MGKLMKSCQLGWMTGLTMLLALAVSSCVAGYPAEYLMGDPELPSRCFRATGHTIGGNFLRYFEAMGGIESLGYPITEPFEQEGRQVQYFEYGRIEDHPDNPKRPVVKLSMLGERLGRRQPPLSPARVPPAFDQNSRYYPQMGHALSGDFLTYFDRYGGRDRFGLPIAEPLISEGKLVQDLQRARLVWHLDRPPGDRVMLELSGHVYFEAQDLDPALLAPVPCPPGAAVVSPNPNQPDPSPHSR
jgi:hypothetical protein